MNKSIVDGGRGWPYQAPDRYRLLAELQLNGQLGRKSNRRQIVTNRKTGKPMVIKSDASLKYVKAALQQIPEQFQQGWGSLEQDLALHVAVFYTSRRPDLSVELLTDILEQAGVIKNDRYIREIVALGFVDKDYPRTIMRLYEIPGDRQPPTFT